MFGNRIKICKITELKMLIWFIEPIENRSNMQAHDDYQPLMNNKSPKSKRNRTEAGKFVATLTFFILPV